MTDRFYFDTLIWLDIYEKRGKNGELALKLVTKIIEENLIVFYSNLNVRELKNLRYSKNEINEIFSIIKLNIKRIHVTKKQFKEGMSVAKQRDVPLGDADSCYLS